MCTTLEGPESVRSHGFQRPWNGMQLLAWIIYALLFVYYFAFLFPLLWTHPFVTPLVTILVLLFALSAGLFGVLTAITNPADEAVLGLSADVEDRVLCYLCNVKVHSSSRHCRICNKCVEDFDHHCKWLNTCVGKKNYRYFLALIAAVTAETILLLVLTVLYLAEAFGGFGNILDRADHAFGESLGGLGLKIVLIMCGVVILSVVALVLQLAGFHVMLVYNSITTYDYIIAEQKRQREKKATKKVELPRGQTNDKRTVPQSQQVPMETVRSAQPEAGDDTDNLAVSVLPDPESQLSNEETRI